MQNLKNNGGGILLKEKHLSYADKVRLFNTFCAEVAIETSTHCNRICSYCPIGILGSRKQQFISDELYDKILAELVSIDYKGIISLSWFNEPLESRDIIEKIKKVNDKLNDCYIRLNSNGDFLTTEYLDTLSQAGLREMLITLHCSPNEEYTDEGSKKKTEVFFKKLGLDYRITSFTENKNISCDMMYKNIRLLVVTNNWSSGGVDRGGAVEELSIMNRQKPCSMPFRTFNIDVNGNVAYCCNLYVDMHTVGSVAEDTIIETYFSEKLCDIRRKVFVFGEKDAPCNTCSQYDYARIETKEMRAKIIEQL